MTLKENLHREFTEIIEKHKGLIFKIAHAYCKNNDEQQDLVQEVIVQLWSSFEKYDPSFKISTWMYRIALNVAISHYRKTKTREKHVLPMSESIIEFAEEQEESKEMEILLLQKFIRQLDPMNKAMMVMYLDGNNHEEISRVLNISKSNVGTKIGRIKEKLKAYFKQN